MNENKRNYGKKLFATGFNSELQLNRLNYQVFSNELSSALTNQLTHALQKPLQADVPLEDSFKECQPVGNLFALLLKMLLKL